MKVPNMIILPMLQRFHILSTNEENEKMKKGYALKE